MISRFSDLHGGLGVPDGLVETPEFGEHGGEAGPRERPLDAGGPESFEAVIALEREVPLEQACRVAELTPGEVCEAQKVRRDHLDRAIAEGARDGEGLRPESGSLVVVTSEHAMAHHEA